MKKETPQERYQKKNMLGMTTKYKKEFIQEYKEALQSLNLKHSDLVRELMIETIEKANKQK